MEHLCKNVGGRRNQRIRQLGFNFEKLELYQRAIEFADHVYSVTDHYPQKEMFGLTNQFRKAAVSIPLNVAEGSARTKKDFRRFLDMARGSVYECMAILQLCLKRDYVGPDKFNQLRSDLITISKMLSGLKRSLAPETMSNEPRTTNDEQ
jgi:four helix bundle protein